jgi:hypothetical protein
MSNRTTIIILLALFGVFLAVELSKPKPIDWTRHFIGSSKDPFGTSLVFENLSTYNNNQEPTVLRVPAYNHCKSPNLPAKSTYLYVNNDAQGLGKNDINALLEFATKGNTIFIASNTFPEKLLDTLHVRIKQRSLVDYVAFGKAQKKQDSLQKKNADGIWFNLEESDFKSDSLKVNLLNKQLKFEQSFVLDKETGENHFVTNDTTRAVALGVNQHGEYNFLKFRFGKGEFFLLTVPEVFCNYYTGQHQIDYVWNALSYLPKKPLYWDEYYKQGREGNQSIFRVITERPPLKWALYLTFLCLGLYVVFEGKRRQRVIPIIEPPKNTSLEFVETIGLLYYEQQNHGDIAQKKITYFLNFVRNRFNLKTSDLQDREFRESLSQKTGIVQDEVNSFLNLLQNTVQTGQNLSEKDLLNLNQAIETFIQKAR